MSGNVTFIAREPSAGYGRCRLTVPEMMTPAELCRQLGQIAKSFCEDADPAASKIVLEFVTKAFTGGAAMHVADCDANDLPIPVLAERRDQGITPLQLLDSMLDGPEWTQEILPTQLQRLSGDPMPPPPGLRAGDHQWNYRQRREKLLLALLDNHADKLDQVAVELGEFFDHLHQVGIRGFVAECTTGADFATLPENRSSVSNDAEASTGSPTDEPRGDPAADAAGFSPDRGSSTRDSR